MKRSLPALVVMLSVLVSSATPIWAQTAVPATHHSLVGCIVSAVGGRAGCTDRHLLGGVRPTRRNMGNYPTPGGGPQAVRGTRHAASRPDGLLVHPG